MHVERRECPAEIQQRITDAVGLNPFGEPMWKIEWGQSRTFTAGGVWPHDHFFGYRQLMASNGSPSGQGTPCWMVMEWHPAEDYETDAVYYFRNRCSDTGLQQLGEYPYSGRYEVALKLTKAEPRNGRMEVIHFHLDGVLIDFLIPMLVKASQMGMRQRMELLKQDEQRKEAQIDRDIDAIYNGARRRPLPSAIDDRVRLIQRHMGKFMNSFGRIQPGFQQNTIKS